MEKLVAELFAGVGGFRLAFDKAGFETTYGNQWEPNKKNQFAYDCYATRFDGFHENVDIATVSTLPLHTVLVGGLPCQDYSVATTKAKGIEGKKGVLFWEYVRLLKQNDTPFFMIENVDRLLKSPTRQRGRDFLVMLATFRDMGYNIEWRVLNAAEHGFAQKRRRIFIFGYKQSTSYAQSQEVASYLDEGFFNTFNPYEIRKGREMTYTLTEDVQSVSDELSLTLWNSGVMVDGEIRSCDLTYPNHHVRMTLGDVLERDVPEDYFLKEESIEKWKACKGAKKIPRVTAEGFAYTYSEGSMSFPDPLDAPARTLLTSEGSLSRSSHVVLDPQKNRLRTLTSLECERLNGFPDHHTATGMTERQRRFVMGNALVVGLVENMAHKLGFIIDSETSNVSVETKEETV